MLTLSPEGLVWRSRLRSTRWSWRDTSRFRPIRVHIAGRRVGFDLADPPDGPKTYTQYYVSYAGADHSLGGGWEIGPERLADLLNAARGSGSGRLKTLLQISMPLVHAEPRRRNDWRIAPQILPPRAAKQPNIASPRLRASA